MLFHIGATCKLSLLCISVYECVACVDCSLRIRSNLILIPDACEGPFLRGSPEQCPHDHQSQLRWRFLASEKVPLAPNHELNYSLLKVWHIYDSPIHLSITFPPGRCLGPKKIRFDTLHELRAETLLNLSVAIFEREGYPLTFSNVHNFEYIFRLTGPIILYFLTPATPNFITTNWIKG